MTKTQANIKNASIPTTFSTISKNSQSSNNSIPDIFLGFRGCSPKLQMVRGSLLPSWQLQIATAWSISRAMWILVRKVSCWPFSRAWLSRRTVEVRR